MYRLLPEAVKLNDAELQSLVDKISRDERTKRLLQVMTAGLCMLIFIGLGWIVYQMNTTVDAIRTTQTANSPIIRKLDHVAMVLEDCINPGGRCYQQSIDNGQQRVDAVNVITELTIACADRPGSQTLPEIQACVKAQYNKEKR